MRTVSAPFGRQGTANVVTVAGWALLVLSGVVLIGWAFDLRALENFVAESAGTKANTATALMLAAVALLRRDHRDLPIYSISVSLIGALTLGEYFRNSNFGIDEILVRDTHYFIYPGRMSQHTAISLVLLGASLLPMKSRHPELRQLSRYLGILTGALGVLAIVSHAYDRHTPNLSRPGASVAIPTAIGLVIGAIGVQYANPSEGIARLFHADNAGGAMLRRLLPAGLLFSGLLGFAVVHAQVHYHWEAGFSLALVSVGVGACLVIGILLTAVNLEGQDLARRESDQRLLMAELREAHEKRYRQLFENMSEGIAYCRMLFDDAGRPADIICLEVNTAFSKLTGLKDVVGKRMTELIPGIRESNPEVFETYGRVVMTGQPEKLEIEMKPLGIWLSTSVHSPEKDHFVVVFDNITERKRSEEHLLRAEKLTSAGRMAAAIAHEINNPLAAVMNLLFLAGSIKELPESARQFLETAEDELKRVAHITRQSLGFYRESSTPEFFPISTALNSALNLLKSRINAKHAIIDKQFGRDVQVTAISGELRQVFSNLLSNSLDAIDERGTIKVRISANEHRVRVSVADNGKGISESMRRHLFEPFFSTKGTVGTGLGLWVSQQIIEKHRGTIGVRSSSDGLWRGTTFSVVLPLGPVPSKGQSTVPLADLEGRTTGEFTTCAPPD